jgi:CRISPR/Cas system-associated exonuclease Cas4 (RecB family)
MDSRLMVGLIALVAVWFLWTWFRKKPSDELGIPGKLVWVDRGKSTKPFFNQEYRVLGKPDLIYKLKRGILAVEYKGRKSNIYDSDIVQGLTASLAARGEGYKVTRLLVKTDNTERYIDLPSSDNGLYKQVSKYIEIVRKAKRGQSLPSIPNHFKCENCAYSFSCKKK